MARKPYFITADGVSVKGNDRVFCIGVQASDLNKHAVFMDYCKVAVNICMHEHIFSTRKAAQDFCDSKNKNHD